MGEMPGNIAKVPISKRIDDLSRDPSKRDAFLEDLKDMKQDYFEVLIKHGVLKRGAEEQHYKEHWFNHNGNGWWKDHPHITHFKEIHRQGMIEAFQEAQNRNLPVDSYWICTGRHLEICVCCSEQQVTRIILTPGVPAIQNPGVFTQTADNILVVKYREPKLEEEVQRDTKHQQLVPKPADPKGGVLTVRLKALPYD